MSHDPSNRDDKDPPGSGGGASEGEARAREHHRSAPLSQGGSAGRAGLRRAAGIKLEQAGRLIAEAVEILKRGHTMEGHWLRLQISADEMRLIGIGCQRVSELEIPAVGGVPETVEDDKTPVVSTEGMDV